MFHYPELDNQGIDSIQISEGKRCVHGHLIWDRHEELHKGADLVTWLRNPVERILSFYNHILSNPDPNNEFHKRVNKEKPSITELEKYFLSIKTVRYGPFSGNWHASCWYHPAKN